MANDAPGNAIDNQRDETRNHMPIDPMPIDLIDAGEVTSIQIGHLSGDPASAVGAEGAVE